jgi:hypothetical protein
MHKKIELVFFLIFIATLVSIVTYHSFSRYFEKKEYSLYTYTKCDPELNNCFKGKKDSENFTFYTDPYAKVTMTAGYAPNCLDEHNCQNFICPAKDSNCIIKYCSDDNLEEGEECSR